MGCHLYWLAILLLPIALWVMKIFRHKDKKCLCDCHETKLKTGKLINGISEDVYFVKNFKPTIITEGNIKRGGVNPMPTYPKPPAKPVGQK